MTELPEHLAIRQRILFEFICCARTPQIVRSKIYWYVHTRTLSQLDDLLKSSPALVGRKTVAVLVKKEIVACGGSWKHWFENLSIDTQHLNSKWCQFDRANAFTAKLLCFAKETNPACSPVHIAAFPFRTYPHQFTYARSNFGLQNDSRVVARR